MSLSKKLKTGTIVRTWNFEEGNTVGQTVAIKNQVTGEHDAIIHIESVDCADGVKDRIVIKKEAIKKAGIIIIEE